MAGRNDHSRTPKPLGEVETVPFDSAEEAWFWFIQAQQARNDGARFTMGAGLVPRPCEPADILKVLDRLYRTRRLVIDHFKVLRHYGYRMLPPDPNRIREGRAFRLWKEALACLDDVLQRKGIVRRSQNSFWNSAEWSAAE